MQNDERLNNQMVSNHCKNYNNSIFGASSKSLGKRNDYLVEFTEGVKENNKIKGSFKIYHKDIDQHMSYIGKNSNASKALNEYNNKNNYVYSDINLKKVIVLLLSICAISLFLFEFYQMYKKIRSDDEVNINYCYINFKENNCEVNINSNIEYLRQECQKLMKCMSHSTSILEYILKLFRF